MCAHTVAKPAEETQLQAAQFVTAKAKGAPVPLTTVGLVQLVSRRVVSEVAVLAGTEIPGGGGRGRPLSPPERFLHSDGQR